MTAQLYVDENTTIGEIATWESKTNMHLALYRYAGGKTTARIVNEHGIPHAVANGSSLLDAIREVVANFEAIPAVSEVLL